jgi:glucokinase
MLYVGRESRMIQPQAVLIGVDVGSTHTSGGLVTLGGEVLSVTEARTHRDGPGTALDTILGVVSHLLAQASDQGRPVEGIGIGLPGIVDIEGGTMRKGFHRVPELVGAPLVELIRARSGVPVFIDNDVNALGLGEWTWGLGRGAGSMVMLALGTGVGGAVILDGHLVRGKSGYGGELGHVSVKFDGRPCVCGIRGCLSAYAAGVGIAAEFHCRTHGDAAGRSAEPNYDEALSDAEAVFRAADAGNADAGAVVREACQAVGAAMGGIANGLNPDVIVITGGILKSLARYEDRILEHAAEYGFAATLADARIHFVPGYKNRTVRGGAALVLYERARRTVLGERQCPTTAEG